MLLTSSSKSEGASVTDGEVPASISRAVDKATLVSSAVKVLLKSLVTGCVRKEKDSHLYLSTYKQAIVNIVDFLTFDMSWLYTCMYAISKCCGKNKKLNAILTGYKNIVSEVTLHLKELDDILSSEHDKLSAKKLAEDIGFGHVGKEYLKIACTEKEVQIA